MKTAELTLLGSGREAEVFAWEPGVALRLARDAWQEPAIARECLGLAAASAGGAPVPEVHGRIEVDGRPGVLIDRVDGEDMLTGLGQRPWRVFPVARALGAIHADLHAIAAPPDLWTLREDMQRDLASDLVPADVREAALRELERLPDGDALLHGDFHPGNLLAGTQGPVAIDWTNASRGDPASDVARTRLILRRAAIPEGTPALTARIFRTGRELLFGGYLRAYRRRRDVDLELVDRWEPVRAAARLAEGIAAEEETLLSVARTLA